MSKFTKYMYVTKKDNGNVTEVFNDFQEKLGMIKKVAIPGKVEWQASIFASKISRSFKSYDQAVRFIEINA